MDTDSSHLWIAGIIVVLFLSFVVATLAHYIQPHTWYPQPQAFKTKKYYIFSLIVIVLTFTLGLAVFALYDSLSIMSSSVVVGGYIVALGVLLLVSSSLSWLVSRYHGEILSSGFLKSVIRKTQTVSKTETETGSISLSENLQELEDRVMAAAEDGAVDDRDREMMKSILRLDFTTVREIMVPSPDMISIEVNASLKDTARLMAEHGHSRIPVYENTKDSIVGIVHSRDLLRLLADGSLDNDLRTISRPAVFVPETKKLDELLQELQENAVQMAIVIDEYGGTEGIVTMEDMLEEIVGEIEDESSSREDPVLLLANGSAVVDAGISLDDFEEILGINIGSGPDVDTLGGYVYRELGRMPYIGDLVSGKDFDIQVVSVIGHRLRKLRIDRVVPNSVSGA